MKVIVAGSRSINNADLIADAIKTSPFFGDITEIVSGGAKGVDTLAIGYANTNKYKVRVFNAKWNDLTVKGARIKSGPHGQYNARAGFMRNEKMGDYADALIAIWDGKSSGTKGMIGYMRYLRKPVFIFEVE